MIQKKRKFYNTPSKSDIPQKFQLRLEDVLKRLNSKLLSIT